MPFSVVSKKSGKTYILHSRNQQLKGGQHVMLYYFAGEAGQGAMEALPDGYEVSENTKTGLPLLKKKAKEGQA
jgi:hypothetical protein